MGIWLVMVGAGLATYAARALFLVGPAWWHLPARLQQTLQTIVPIAAFAALALPGLLLLAGSLALSPFSNSRLLAGVVAAYVAWHIKRAPLAVLAGMLVLWLTTWTTS